jgi:pimeloyl-ACP methyl ester carboxylesterase
MTPRHSHQRAGWKMFEVELHPGLLAGLPHAWYRLAIVARSSVRLLSAAGVSACRATCSDTSRPTPPAGRRTTSRCSSLHCAIRPWRVPPPRSIAASSSRRRCASSAAPTGTRLTTRTRLLIGADDQVVRAELLGGYEDHVDDLAIEVVDGASHWVVDERPDVVTRRALESFG